MMLSLSRVLRRLLLRCSETAAAAQGHDVLENVLCAHAVACLAIER
jgi:hypothetical protein